MHHPQRTTSANKRGWQSLLVAGTIALSALTLGSALWPSVHAQAPAPSAQPMITTAINESSRVTLSGNIRPEAKNLANDRGAVADSMPMPHMMLQLRRSPAQQQALDTLINQLHDPQSPNYHRWLTPDQFGSQFGLAPSDIQTITTWLSQHGFAVNSVYPNRTVIDFSGTAGQVRSAFGTEIHYLEVNGATRYANMNDPQIPAALAPAVVGITSLHDIPPKPMMRRVTPQYTPSGFACGINFAFQCYLLTPADLATIYNFKPIFSGGNTGQGQTIYLIEDSDLFGGTAGGTNNDWATFRSTFGLSPTYSATITTVHPGGCADPGVNGDGGEAILDAEWASAAAPSAAIVMATCTNILTAIQNVINGANPPAIMSISYGACEAALGVSGNAAFNSTYQQGVAEGMSIFVSAGDADGAVCDDFNTAQAATQGLAVSGFASTPYNVAVGGTDFSDTYSATQAGPPQSTYWNSTNTTTFGSAKSYIPEIPWNDSCGSQLLTNYVAGVGTATYTFCNTATAANDHLLDIVGGSGGPSGVYSKPSWQSGLVGNPSDGARDLPDVSLFAADGEWGHAYIFCWSDSSNGGIGCTGAPVTWNLGGGTSFSSPIWAGIQALINQNSGEKQGLPNSILYKIASSEYGPSGSSSCNSSNGASVAASCIFYDVTLGDDDADCSSGSPNCYAPSGSFGVLSTSTSSFQPAYKTQTGWDFATGIGTVNVANLVNAWSPNGGSTAITVSVTGSGTVASSPSGISCPSTCTAAFTGGTQVTLTPTPASGWAFSSWGGACSGSGGCSVTMNAAQSVSAAFVQIFALSVNVSGSGTVTSSPAGISCPSTCSANYTSGAQVTLTPTPATGFIFTGWSGACSGTGSCTVTMNSAQSVTATFTAGFALTVSVTGSGTVTSSPSGISCPSTCSANFTSGTQVTLSEAPTTGSSFNGWGGACSGLGACTVTMNAAKSVSASFVLGEPQTGRIWVSASGSDSNPCTRTAPCLTFAGALAKTPAGGEIDVLTPGDFGPVTITKAVSIYNDAVGATGVMTSAGTSGITINAGGTDVINLRGVIFDGVNASGTSGVVFNSGAQLHIQNCLFQGFTTSGITFSPGAGSATTAALVVQDTTVLGNATGISIKPTGGIAANVTLGGLHIDKNTGNGLTADGTGGSGAITLSVGGSSISLNSGSGINAASGPGSVTVNITRTVVASNGAAGIQSDQSAGGSATVTIGSSAIYGNTIAAQSVSGGALLSYSNNKVTGNGTDGTFTGVASLQ